MAEAIAELNSFTQEDFIAPQLVLVPDPEIYKSHRQPEVFLAKEVPYETLTQGRFECWYGSLLLKRTVEFQADEAEKTDQTDLLEMLHQTINGSSKASNMVDENLGAAASEVCFKDSHIRKVSAQVNESGQILQYGQTMLSIHTNAITMRPNRHPALEEITRIEALNGQRIEDGLRAGILKDYYHLVVSVVPKGVPEVDLGYKGDGYFLESLTFAIQATTEDEAEDEDKQVSIESAFMAGVDENKELTFEERMDQSFYMDVISKVYRQLRQEAPQTAAELLDSGLYISKELMPNGVADFMRWCDEAHDELVGRQVERKPEDYIKIVDESKKREASLSTIKHKVKAELIASTAGLSDPMQAVRLMWQLIKDHAVEDSFSNYYIRPIVFGAVAAPYIEEIRHNIEQGSDKSIEDLKQRARDTAVVSGCGGGASAKTADGVEDNNQGKKSNKSEEDEFGPLTFNCPKGHRNKRPRGRLISNCRTCGTSVKC